MFVFFVIVRTATVFSLRFCVFIRLLSYFGSHGFLWRVIHCYYIMFCAFFSPIIHLYSFYRPIDTSRLHVLDGYMRDSSLREGYGTYLITNQA